MYVRLLVLNDNPTQHLAECTANGAALNCRWTGPGDNGGPNDQRVAFFRGAFSPPAIDPLQTFELPMSSGDLRNVSLVGACSDVISPDVFANAVEVRKFMAPPSAEDNVARDGVKALNVAVADLGQEQADMKRHLREAGA